MEKLSNITIPLNKSTIDYRTILLKHPTVDYKTTLLSKNTKIDIEQSYISKIHDIFNEQIYLIGLV